MKKKVLKISLLLVIICIFITGCIFNKAISADEFDKKLSAKGYNVQDETNQFKQYNFIKKVYIALEKGSKYKIEFYELNNENNTIRFFNTNKRLFEQEKDKSSIETSINGKHNAKYTLITKDNYKVISRIDNTAIFIDTNKKYTKEIKKVLRELGY